jgi:predicted ATPase
MIDNIRLKNFKCFIDEPFEISQLTLFTGVNGMGKSSIIQSLLLLKQSYASTLLQTQSKVDLWNFSFTDLQSAENLCNIDAYPKNISIELESNDFEFKWDIDASTSDDTQLPAQYNGNKEWTELNLFNSNFIYIDAERIGPRKSYPRKTERVFNTRLGIQGELTPVYIFDAISQNAKISLPGLKHPKIEGLDFYENLNAWIGDILGREATAKVSAESKEEVSLSFGIKGGQGGDFSAMQVGFGYSFSLPVITAALICNPGDLLIVENPEAHLHPAAQTKIGILLSLVAQNGVQVMIETHSDHVLNGIRVMIKGFEKYGKISHDLLKVHFFYNEKIDNEDVPSRKMLTSHPNGKLSGWPSGFFDEWENNLEQLLS